MKSAVFMVRYNSGGKYRWRYTIVTFHYLHSYKQFRAVVKSRGKGYRNCDNIIRALSVYNDYVFLRNLTPKYWYTEKELLDEGIITYK